ncbi:hypothetical protein LSH36_134g05035 [Paralvinella palmiformis]|uniref:SOCS box domain-containing protein n=1 Tax=Paralvinella palmiformis TaxID=53620 RepID=A0AAD9N9W9_9ANNE|nr:hypothetical protein LSH36_134g05035 [Paralvinella palmiformis]
MRLPHLRLPATLKAAISVIIIIIYIQLIFFSILSAVQNNNGRILNLLVAVPGSVSRHNLNEGLLRAVTLGYPECLDVLLKAGADPELLDSTGNTLLKISAEGGRTNMMMSLIRTGCSVNARNHNGASALHFAARSGQSEAVTLLLNNGALMFGDSGGSTPLIMAARNCHKTLGTMKLLIDATDNLDAQDRDGKTALHYTAHRAIGYELLLAAGANPNIQDYNGNTPMIMAATEGFDNVIECLIRYDANPDLMNTSNKSALHFLAMKNHWQAIEAIASGHGNMDIQDGNSNVPLWYAVAYNRPEAVKALLRANCHPNPPLDPDGVPLGGDPLKTALERKLYGIAKLLVLSGCRLPPLYEWLETIEERRSRPPEHPSLFAGEEEEEEEEDEEEIEAEEWFEDWVHSPHSLRQICRVWIRQFLGASVITASPSLPVPQSMRDYITLKEVEDHHIVAVLL